MMPMVISAPPRFDGLDVQPFLLTNRVLATRWEGAVEVGRAVLDAAQLWARAPFARPAESITLRLLRISTRESKDARAVSRF